jgi:putative glutamine transport system permease protein
MKVIVDHWPDILHGFAITVQVTVLSALLSTLLGILLGIARASPSKIVKGLAGAYVEFFRNIPPLVLLFFFFFGLPRLEIVFSSFTCGVLGLALYHAGFVAEILRAGIESVGRHQMEAGRALGFTFIGTMRYVLLPQAGWIVLPPLTNLLISLFKTSTLVATIGVHDLIFQAEVLHERTFQTAQIFGFVGLVYLSISLLLGVGLNWLNAFVAARRAGYVA